MTPTVTICETAAVGCNVTAEQVRDLSHIRQLLLSAALRCQVATEGVRDAVHVRRLLLEGLFAVGGDVNTTEEHTFPVVTLALLRSFLATHGCNDKGQARLLLLMALLQLEDEDDAQRFVMPHAVLPLVIPGV